MKTTIKRLYDSLGRFRALYMLSALELAIMISWSVYTGEGVTYCIDTETYYEAYEVLAAGRLDVFRLPLYPLIIGGAKSIFGYKVSIAVVYIYCRA